MALALGRGLDVLGVLVGFFGLGWTGAGLGEHVHGEGAQVLLVGGLQVELGGLERGKRLVGGDGPGRGVLHGIDGPVDHPGLAALALDCEGQE